MTDRQKNFCWEYVSNGYNAYQAFKKVHVDVHSVGGIKSGAYRYMKDVEVRGYIDELMDNLYEQNMAKAESIIIELTEVAFQRREIIGDNYNESGKLKALELLQKQLGLQTTNQKIESKVEQVVFVEDLD